MNENNQSENVKEEAACHKCSQPATFKYKYGLLWCKACFHAEPEHRCHRCGKVPAIAFYADKLWCHDCDGKCIDCGKETHCFQEEHCSECLFRFNMRQFSELLAKLPPNIKTVGGVYDGSNDSGDFQDIAGFEEPALKPGDDEISSWYDMDCRNKVKLDGQCEGSLCDYLSDILERKCGGWEINEGSRGSFVVDVATQKIRHDHTYRIEEFTSKTYELRGK